MITFNGKKGQFHILQKSDNTGGVALKVGDEILIPSNPIWISEGDGSNPNYRLRVMAVKLVDGKKIVSPIFKSAFVVRDRSTNEWVQDGDNLAEALRSSHSLFSELVHGHKMKVTEEIDYQAFEFTPSGDRVFNEDGSPKLRKATTYKWEKGDAMTSDEDTEVTNLIKDFCKSNYDVDTTRYKG